MSERRLVVTADDLGASRHANDAILEAAGRGIVTQASLLANGAAAEDAARRTGERLVVGVHLNLTEGRALTGAIRGATDAAGRFRGPALLLLGAAAGRLDLDAARRELEGQLERARSLGIDPAYADGHHHVHVFPGLLDIVAGLGLPLVRVPDEPGGGKRALLGWLSRGARERLREAGLATTDHFRGLALFRCAEHRARLLETLRTLPEGDTELMTHPGDAVGGAIELASLCDPAVRTALQAAEVRLVSARELAPAA